MTRTLLVIIYWPATPFVSKAPQGWYEWQQMAFYHLRPKYMHLVQDFDEHRDQEARCSVSLQRQSSTDVVRVAETGIKILIRWSFIVDKELGLILLEI